jgi:hypothetical protein
MLESDGGKHSGVRLIISGSKARSELELMMKFF